MAAHTRCADEGRAVGMHGGAGDSRAGREAGGATGGGGRVFPSEVAAFVRTRACAAAAYRASVLTNPLRRKRSRKIPHLPLLGEGEWLIPKNLVGLKKMKLSKRGEYG